MCTWVVMVCVPTAVVVPVGGRGKIKVMVVGVFAAAGQGACNGCVGVAVGAVGALSGRCPCRGTVGRTVV